MTDFAGFHELGESLLLRLTDRLSAEDRADLELYLWEEEALMVEELAGVLVHDQVPIDRAERDMVAKLIDYFPNRDPDESFYVLIRDRDVTLAALNVIDEP